VNTLKELAGSRIDQENMSASRLAKLYSETIDELRLCAKDVPGSNAEDRKANETEAALLDFEADLLDQAARIQIRNKRDADILMDIWAKVSGVDAGRGANPSDRIAMNVFRYINNIDIAKG